MTTLVRFITTKSRGQNCKNLKQIPGSSCSAVVENPVSCCSAVVEISGKAVGIVLLLVVVSSGEGDAFDDDNCSTVVVDVDVESIVDVVVEVVVLELVGADNMKVVPS